VAALFSILRQREGEGRHETTTRWRRACPYASTVLRKPWLTMTGDDFAGECDVSFVAISKVAVFASAVSGPPPLSRTPNVNDRPYSIHTTSARRYLTADRSEWFSQSFTTLSPGCTLSPGRTGSVCVRPCRRIIDALMSILPLLFLGDRADV
jgi:hypothetical protein